MTFFQTTAFTSAGFGRFDITATRACRVRFHGKMWTIVDRSGWHAKVIRGLTAQGVRDYLAANA